QASGAGPETVVGVALQRSAELVVALLAVMRTGAAYVPLDLEYPMERLAWMIQDSGMSLMITRPACRDALPEHGHLPVLAPDAQPADAG
ncbi:AMP-binding protein, partial [Pseudomonas sp. SIMBA_065]